MKVTFLAILLILFSSVNSQITLNWSKISTFPSIARTEFAHFLIDSNFYIIGGGENSTHFFDEVWVYNLNSNLWKKKNSFKGGKTAGTSGFTINNIGYVFVGLTDTNNNINCDNGLWMYNEKFDTWSKKASLPVNTREVASVFTYLNSAYLGLGYPCNNALSDLWRYESINDVWSKLDSLPSEGRYGTPALVIDSNAYFTCGTFDNQSYTNETWNYKITTNKWIKVGNLPDSGRVSPVSLNFKNFFLIGYGYNNNFNLKKLGNMYLYDNQLNKWTRINNQGFFDSVYYGASFIYKNRGYFFGGYTTGSPSYLQNKDMYSFDATPLINYLGVEEAESKTDFKVYPNPVTSSGAFQIATSQHGEVSFYNTIGQLLYSSPLEEGFNQFNKDKMNGANEVVMYRAVLKDGTTQNGKLVLLR